MVSQGKRCAEYIRCNWWDREEQYDFVSFDLVHTKDAAPRQSRYLLIVVRFDPGHYGLQSRRRPLALELYEIVHPKRAHRIQKQVPPALQQDHLSDAILLLPHPLQQETPVQRDLAMRFGRHVARAEGLRRRGASLQEPQQNLRTEGGSAERADRHRCEVEGGLEDVVLLDDVAQGVSPDKEAQGRAP